MKNVVRAVVAATCLVVAGCANDGPTAGPAESPTGLVNSPDAGGSRPGASPPIVNIVAADNRFDPVLIEVAPGTEVVWENRGRNEHDLLSEFAFGAVAADFQPGEEYRHVFTEPGEYPYYCTIHGTQEVGMIGVIVVTDTA